MKSSIVKLNGGYTPLGNYIWGAALTLAWKQLVQDIIHEPIQIVSEDHAALQITQNYNQIPVSKGILSQDSYYVRSGFGNSTVRQINVEVKQKFPQKTTQPIKENLHPTSIISYAYFFKKLNFIDPFLPKQVKFQQKMVPGFHAKSLDQKKQVLIMDYKDRDNFIIELKTKAKQNGKGKGDRLFIIKQNKKMSAEEILEKSNTLKLAKQTLSKDDIFEMPKVSLSVKRDVKELLGVFLKNKEFQDYFFSQFFEIIKLDIDEVGVKVENEGVIIMSRGAVMRPVLKKEIILDRPFWIIMREGDNHPYFIAKITELCEKN